MVGTKTDLKKAVPKGGFLQVHGRWLDALLGSGGTLCDTHGAETDEGNLLARAEHEAREGVFGFAVGGQTDIEGLGAIRADGGGGRHQIDLLLGDVGHEDDGVLLAVLSTEGVGTVPRDGQVLACGGDGDLWQVVSRRVAEGVDVAQVDALGVAIDGGELRELLDKSVVAGHAADVFGEQEFHLFVRELAGDVQDFLEEAALGGLRCGLRVFVGLGEATHVADAVPRGTDDGADFTSESTEDSLLDFTHDN